MYKNKTQKEGNTKMPLDYSFTGFEINKMGFPIQCVIGDWKVKLPSLIKQIIITDEIINGEPAIYYRLEHEPELIKAVDLFETGELAFSECEFRNNNKHFIK